MTLNAAPGPNDDHEDHLIAMRIRDLKARVQDFTAAIRSIPSDEWGEPLPKELQDQGTAFEADRTTLLDQAQGVFRPLEKALSDLARGEGEASSVFAAADSVKVMKPEILQQATTLASRGRELFEASIKPRSVLAKETATSRSETLEAVKDDLERIGSGLVATQAGRHNMAESDAAERQLNHLAQRNTRYVAADSTAVDAENRVNSAREKARLATQCAKELHQMLTNLTLKDLDF